MSRTATNATVTVSDIPNAIIEFLDPKTGEWTNELAYVDVRMDDGKVAPYVVTYRVTDPAGNYATKTDTTLVTVNPRQVPCRRKSSISFGGISASEKSYLPKQSWMRLE